MHRPRWETSIPWTWDSFLDEAACSTNSSDETLHKVQTKGLQALERRQQMNCFMDACFFRVFMHRDMSAAAAHGRHLKWPAASLARDEMTDEKVFRSGSSCSACKLSNNCMVASWYLRAGGTLHPEDTIGKQPRGAASGSHAHGPYSNGLRQIISTDDDLQNIS